MRRGYISPQCRAASPIHVTEPRQSHNYPD
jgi:hypothetical protein